MRTAFADGEEEKKEGNDYVQMSRQCRYRWGPFLTLPAEKATALFGGFSSTPPNVADPVARG